MAVTQGHGDASVTMKKQNPLGEISAYPDSYDVDLLFPIDRNESWKASGQSRADIPFYGVDIWNAYEISWLNSKGKPVVCMAEFHIPATSQYLVESKSFKLYLNSFNQTRFKDAQQVTALMQKDLSAAVCGEVQVRFHDMGYQAPEMPQVKLLDDIDLEITDYSPNPDLLSLQKGQFEGWLCSHLLKSNCPVTGQPDWGSLFIHYKGQQIDEAGLLGYIISLRQHQDFHELCVERTFNDLWNRCKPESLTVYARYVRRGGLDINPYRTSEQDYSVVNFRVPRQ